MVAKSQRDLALIAYRCSTEAHARYQPRETSTMTFHLDGWAYCPAPVAHGHRWVSTGGVPLRGLLAGRQDRAVL